MSAMDAAVEAYVAATLNEAFIDEAGVRAWGLSEILPAAIPRPLRVASWAQRQPRRLRWVVRVVVRLWPIPLQPLLAAAQAVRYLFGWIVAHALHQPPRLGPECAVCTTSRLPGMLARIGSESTPPTWLTVPWIEVSAPPTGATSVPLLRAARIGDLVWAFTAAARGARAIARQNPDVGRLQGYTALPWMLVWRVLSRHASSLQSLWFANHYDRWAVLFDRLPGDFPRTLVQHGFLYGRPLPTRLANVRRVFSFGARYERQFREAVLSPNTEVRFETIAISLDLTPLDGADRRPSLLIIGLPPHAEKQCELIRALLASRPDLRILVKPHPLYDPGPYRSACDRSGELVGGTDFPRVDLALADESWLGVEYEASDVDVLWHLDLDVNATLREVDRRLPPLLH